MDNNLTAQGMFEYLGFSVSKEDDYSITYTDEDDYCEIYMDKDCCIEASKKGYDGVSESMLIEKAFVKAIVQQFKEWNINLMEV